MPLLFCSAYTCSCECWMQLWMLNAAMNAECLLLSFTCVESVALSYIYILQFLLHIQLCCHDSFIEQISYFLNAPLNIFFIKSQQIFSWYLLSVIEGNSSMFMLFLLRPLAKWCYHDFTMHLLYFLLRERAKAYRRECPTCDWKRRERGYGASAQG